jgi:two-component system, chemotaxis family, sensor histidine kinase and response regulator WspE
VSEPDFSAFSMLDLFRIEVENQSKFLTDGLLALERDGADPASLEICMRAAHSLKGAARVVDLPQAVALAHAMEEVFVAAQRGALRLTRAGIDLLLKAVDLMGRIAASSEGVGAGEAERAEGLAALQQALADLMTQEAPAGGQAPDLAGPPPEDAAQEVSATPEAVHEQPGDRMVRVAAESLNRLLGLAGEQLMEAGSRRPFNDAVLRLKRMQGALGTRLGDLHGESLGGPVADLESQLAEARSAAILCQDLVARLLTDLDTFDRRAIDLAHRLYDETLLCRMRPFADGVGRLTRLVRDLGRSLGKETRLEIVGGRTSVDRDILEQIDAPLVHLLRNAVDHGIETPDIRLAAGKPGEGRIRLEASHSAGFLLIAVQDDGRGIDLEQLRQTIVSRQLVSAETGAALTEAELLEFLFLPRFTLRTAVTEISGRGVGLDAVKAMVKQVHGVVRVTSEVGRFTRFQLQLPLTLSLVRVLLVEIDGEPYGFPLVGIARAMTLPREEVGLLEGMQHIHYDGRQIGLATGHQLLGRDEDMASNGDLSVVVLNDTRGTYALAVDRFIGQRELSIRPLDPRLGKIKDIAAAALMDDGTPVLIVDIDDLIRSIEKLAASRQLTAVRRRDAEQARARRKRILVVDDSLTVRELERKLLTQAGYDVDVAVDGMDGWNAIRGGHFDLVVTDVDMPRMDGIELVTSIKRDARLRACPVMIVSYKDHETDRRRGLDAGADYYLAKGSFHDTSLINAVVDLIGGADQS